MSPFFRIYDRPSEQRFCVRRCFVRQSFGKAIMFCHCGKSRRLCFSQGFMVDLAAVAYRFFRLCRKSNKEGLQMGNAVKIRPGSKSFGCSGYWRAKISGKDLQGAGISFFPYFGDDVFCDGHYRLYCSLCDDCLYCRIFG